MQIVEQKVTSGDRALFELDEFFGRPLFAHLATNSEHGPRESPVWFLWKDEALWVIGGTSFPTNLERDPRCAVGIVDFDPTTGLVQHVGLRGTAAVLPLEPQVVTLIFVKYMGDDQNAWDPRFLPSVHGEEDVPMIRITPDTVVVREQSYTLAR